MNIPIFPNQGVVFRLGIKNSMSAMGTLVLQTVCNVRTNKVHQALIPSSGIGVLLRRLAFAYEGLKRDYVINPSSKIPYANPIKIIVGHP